MNKAKPYMNRFVKRKQQQITDIYHTTNLKDIKPITSKLMQHSQTIIINNSKREMIKETRQTEIQRQNKLLLQKISSVMNKKGSYSVSKNKNYRTKINKSLNEIFRKKQMEDIQIQNKRFLSRLQNKKPTLNIQKLNKEWLDNKSTIKRMANYQFYLTNLKMNSSRMRSSHVDRLAKEKYDLLKISKFRNINGHKMLIKIQFTDQFLKIVGDSQDKKDLKVIEIPKQEGIQFIQHDCKGKIEILMQKLRYDDATETLYLLGDAEAKDVDQVNPEATKTKNQKNQIHDERINKSSIIQGKTLKQKKSEEKIHQTISHHKKSIQKEKVSEKNESIKSKKSEKKQTQKKQTEKEEKKSIEKEKSIPKAQKSEEKVQNRKSQEKIQEETIEKKQVKAEPEDNEVYEEQFEESGNINNKAKQQPINNL